MLLRYSYNIQSFKYLKGVIKLRQSKHNTVLEIIDKCYLRKYFISSNIKKITMKIN